MQLIKGSQLTPALKHEVLASYVHRWTFENPHRTTVYKCALCDIRKPYVNAESANGHTHPTIPLIHDDQWLAEHSFYVTNKGKLSERHHGCEPA